METLSKSDLLDCFKSSDLYDQFDDEIIIPKKYLLDSLEIKNEEHFYKILNKLRYWMVNELPFEIYHYVDNNKNINLDNFKDFFHEELQLLIKYENLDLMHEISKNGFLNLMKYAHENGCPWNATTCSFAAQNGHLDCLKYAHENGCPLE